MATPLFIDDRAGSRDLMEWLPAETTELCRLEFGDALLVGNAAADATVTVGVEVKSVHDLLQSANTGRLAGRQLPGLLAAYDLTWLLVYGGYRPGADGVLQVKSRGGWKTFKVGSRHVPYSYLESFLFDVVATGCRVKHVHCAEDAAVWLTVLHRWWSKPWSQHKGLRQFDKSQDLSLLPGMDAATAQVARVASALPGIGFERACAVAAYFDNIDTMINASASEWALIPGIGKVIAQTIVRTIKGE